MKVYQDLLGREAKYEDMAQKLDTAVATIADKMAKIQGQQAPATPKGNGCGRGHKLNEYFDAVVAVLKAAGHPLHYNEIRDAVVAAGYAGPVPGNTYSHLYSQSKKGLLKFEGSNKFALVS